MHLFRNFVLEKQHEKNNRSKKEDLDDWSSNLRGEMLGKLSKCLHIITLQPPQYKFLKYVYYIYFFLKKAIGKLYLS